MQVIVAEWINYAAVFYLDSLIAVLAILVIPFLRNRKDQPGEDDMLAEPESSTF